MYETSWRCAKCYIVCSHDGGDEDEADGDFLLLAFFNEYSHENLFAFLLFSSSVRDVLAGLTINRILFRFFLLCVEDSEA